MEVKGKHFIFGIISLSTAKKLQVLAIMVGLSFVYPHINCKKLQDLTIKVACLKIIYSCHEGEGIFWWGSQIWKSGMVLNS